jgi:hypothetical protein
VAALQAVDRQLVILTGEPSFPVRLVNLLYVDFCLIEEAFAVSPGNFHNFPA